METINIDEFIDAMPFACHGYRNKIKSEMMDFAKGLLQLAAENADYGISQNDDGQEPWIHESNIFVEKESIINTINQVI
jgi:hypothetical protein